MIETNLRDVKTLEKDLKQLAGKAYPFATKATINRAAFETRSRSQDIIREKMITRNRWTVGSVKVEQARTLNVRRQEAIVGSTEGYMADQEFGGLQRRTGRQGVSITTSYAAGQEGAQPRTRVARKANTIRAIRLRRRPGGASRGQRNKLAVMDAVASSRKFVYMDLGKRKGIFRVLGGKRNPRVKMVHDLTRQTIRIPRRPWLAPAVREAERELPRFYADALEFQLRRQGLLGR